MVVETARQWIAMNDSRIVVPGRYDNRDPKQARPAAGNVGVLSVHGGLGRCANRERHRHGGG